jgi:hypothetical protein
MTSQGHLSFCPFVTRQATEPKCPCGRLLSGTKGSRGRTEGYGHLAWTEGQKVVVSPYGAASVLLSFCPCGREKSL